MARYIKFVDALNKVVRVILVGMFIMMFLTAFLQVIIRNMTTGSIPWSDELCRYLIIFIVWLGAGLAARSNRLIRMEVLPSLTKMSDRNLHIMYCISNIISLGFAVLTIYCAVGVISVNYKTVSPALQLSMAVPYAAIPVGCVYLILNMLASDMERMLQAKEEKQV